MDNEFEHKATDLVVKSLIIKYRPKNYKPLHTVLVIWESPFGTIEKRSGCFDNYTEAKLFASALKEEYSKYKMKFSIYLISLDYYTKLYTNNT